ncbi:LysR family transcriptional regulator [Sphingomonas sp.]|uniref:LysR family transcriptional regulator n=1 Tax=Sphingomonas sp. TaxID=28214 RepID=UPI001B141155|nr:LysR family transcriptional regulator [Sphingomonas sp.]MBO9712625.1 LysR family transcriptional regulator [Sphingomonas sp.]
MNERPSLNELAALASIATHRSFRKAADELELSPSTLSHMMRTLEGRMGTRLLNRTTRSVVPTDAGERLVASLHPILRDLDAALSDVATMPERPGGLLRLAAPESVAMQLLQTVVPSYLAAFPEMALDLVAEDGPVDIMGEGFDAAIRQGDIVPRDMTVVPFGSPSRMIPVAAPAYLEGREAPQSPEDLPQHDCLRLRLASGRVQRWEFERHGQPLAIDIDGRLTLGRPQQLVEAALRGLGIAYVAERLARAPIAEGRLLPLLPDWCPEYPGLFLYHSARRHIPGGLRTFIYALKTWSARGHF